MFTIPLFTDTLDTLGDADDRNDLIFNDSAELTPSLIVGNTSFLLRKIPMTVLMVLIMVLYCPVIEAPSPFMRTYLTYRHE